MSIEHSSGIEIDYRRAQSIQLTPFKHSNGSGSTIEMSTTLKTTPFEHSIGLEPTIEVFKHTTPCRSNTRMDWNRQLKPSDGQNHASRTPNWIKNGMLKRSKCPRSASRTLNWNEIDYWSAQHAQIIPIKHSQMDWNRLSKRSECLNQASRTLNRNKIDD